MYVRTYTYVHQDLAPGCPAGSPVIQKGEATARKRVSNFNNSTYENLKRAYTRGCAKLVLSRAESQGPCQTLEESQPIIVRWARRLDLLFWQKKKGHVASRIAVHDWSEPGTS